MNETFGICPTCGRGICEDCSVMVINVPHCKDCTEWILFQMATASRMLPRLPMPKGMPNKIYFNIGGIGAIVLSLISVGIGYFFFVNSTNFELSEDNVRGLLFMSGLFAGVFAITGFGFLGFHKNYGSFIGWITFVFFMITPFIFTAFTIFSLHGEFDDREGEHFHIGPEYIGVAIIIGICLVLMGITLILVRNYTMIANLSTATGIFSIIVAGLFCTVFMVIILGIAWFALTVLFISLALVFFGAKLPPKYIGNPPIPSDHLHQTSPIQ
ncbi:MAG: hypothetical protein JSV09_03210 [Thermoplasmata archaeon]|nr:MAG: hypothetical protein JSV09_03210 [Thermoplasmata archaeon]